MIDDFREPAVGTDHTADVCIVGAGPAGIAIASRLMGTGTSVLLVESGGLDDDGGAGRLNQGHVVGLGLGLEQGRSRVFGGTGTVWPGQCIRLDPSDFAVRSWVPDSGWPIAAEAVTPFYERAEAWLGIPAKASDEQAWRRFGLVPAAFDDALLTHKASVYSPRPDVGEVHRRSFARSPEVRVLLHATAATIRTNERATAATELEIRSLNGRVGRVRARRFVLCAGGIENARLLLLSGLGNRHDVVGRYLQEHPTIWADVETDDLTALQRFYGLLGRGKVRYLPKIGLSCETQRRQEVLNASATVIYDQQESPGLAAAREISSALQQRRRPRVSRTELRDALGEVDRVATAGFRRFARGRPSPAPVTRTRLKILVEQAPDPQSRVLLSSQRDELGLPQVCVDWRLSALERRTTRVFTDVMDAELRRLGLGSVVGTEWLDGDDWTSGFEDAYHPMGTTRMSTDPTKGVVDGDCRVHGVDGLYVCGSSVFPTSGYANPTLTLVALALRLADHLAATPGQAPSWT